MKRSVPERSLQPLGLHQWVRFTFVLLAGSFLLCPFVLASPALAQDMALDYIGRYNHQGGGPDHLLEALPLSGDRALVAGNLGLALVDLTALPVGGTQQVLDRLTGLNARDVYTADEHWLYVNLNRGNEGESPGLAIVELAGNQLSTGLVLDEPEVMYEKMCLDGGYLYVAAHSNGLRVFDLTDPAAPVLVGSLETGLTDAFAVDVDGDVAYVADGAGGLKIVDVTDPASPVLVSGEDLTTAAGTSEAISVRGGHVYVAAGGAGVAFYPGGDPAARINYKVLAAAEDLAWCGDYLVVSDFQGFLVFQADAAGALTQVTGETAHRRGSNASLRLCEGVGALPDGRILCGNWNYMDVYELLPVAASTQPDINASLQRIRFAPEGGDQAVAICNQGGGALTITGVTVTDPAFSCDYNGGTLLPGESASCLITYDGSPGFAEGRVMFQSNDPDENPLPIQVFGRTQYLDPGEPALDFTLPVWSKDPGSNWITEQFTLSAHAGKIVWLQVYGTW